MPRRPKVLPLVLALTCLAPLPAAADPIAEGSSGDMTVRAFLATGGRVAAGSEEGRGALQFDVTRTMKPGEPVRLLLMASGMAVEDQRIEALCDITMITPDGKLVDRLREIDCGVAQVESAEAGVYFLNANITVVAEEGAQPGPKIIDIGVRDTRTDLYVPVSLLAEIVAE